MCEVAGEVLHIRAIDIGEHIITRTMIEVGSQLCLQDIAERVSPIVFQCDRIASRSAPMLLVYTRNDVVRAVGEQVIGEGACFLVAVVLIEEVVSQCPFRFTSVDLCIDHVVAIAGQCLRKVGAELVSCVTTPCVDIDDEGNVLTIAHAGIVDIVNGGDALRVECCQVGL